MPSCISPGRAGARGAINYVVLGFLLLVSATAYLGYAYMPHWFQNRQVVSAMREAGYQAWREEDDTLRQMIETRVHGIFADEVAGTEEDEAPVIDASMIEIERDDTNVYISLSYDVRMYFPWTEKFRDLHFDNRVTTDLRTPTR